MERRPPHVVIDTTITNSVSEFVKSFVREHQLPTISALFAQSRDVAAWQNLTEKQLEYLIQVS